MRTPSYNERAEKAVANWEAVCGIDSSLNKEARRRLKRQVAVAIELAFNDGRRHELEVKHEILDLDTRT